MPLSILNDKNENISVIISTRRNHAPGFLEAEDHVETFFQV